MINEADYKYLSESILELHKTMGQTISYVKPIVIQENVYSESKYAKYSKPIDLQALVKYSPTLEELSPIGLDKKATLLVTLSSLELLEKDLLQLKDINWLQSRFIVNDDYFTILSVRPCNGVIGKPIQYKFECKAVDYNNG